MVRDMRLGHSKTAAYTAYPSSNHTDANGLFQAALRLATKVAPEQFHESGHFGGRSSPIIRRECVKSECADFGSGSGLDNLMHGTGSFKMSSGSRQSPLQRPSTVTVHDDCDMHMSEEYFI
jgi:hypothetical protein